MRSELVTALATSGLVIFACLALYVAWRQVKQSREDHVFDAYENYHVVMLEYSKYGRGIDNVDILTNDDRGQYLIFVLYVMTLDERILRLFSPRRRKDEFARGYIESVGDDIRLHTAMLAHEDFDPYRNMFIQELNDRIKEAVTSKTKRPMSVHKHLLVSAKISRSPKTVEEASVWIEELCRKINMNILHGPFGAYSTDPCSHGITVGAIITTSHIIAHFWDKEDPMRLELDVYSCKEFDPKDVLETLSPFDPNSIKCKMLDRSSALTEIGPPLDEAEPDFP